MTIAAWIRPTGDGQPTQDVVKKANTTGTTVNGYELSLSSAGKVFVRLNQATSADTFRVNSTTSYPLNNTAWMHVAATYDGTTIRLYINGVLEGSVAGPAAIATNSLILALGAQSEHQPLLHRPARRHADLLVGPHGRRDHGPREPAHQRRPGRGGRQLLDAHEHHPRGRGAPASSPTTPTPMATRSPRPRSPIRPRHGHRQRQRRHQLRPDDRLQRSRQLHLQGQRRHGRLEHRHRQPDRNSPHNRRWNSTRRPTVRAAATTGGIDLRRGTPGGEAHPRR